MKFNFKMPKKLLIGISTIALSALLVMPASYAIQIEDSDLSARYTEGYEEWLQFSEEMQKAIPLPNNYNAIIPKDILTEYSGEKIPSIIDALKPTDGGDALICVGASYSDTSYNLNKDAKIRVKHQGNTNECWAFSIISSFESNISLTEHNMTVDDYSERHMDYATSRTFKDGINEKGFGREVGDGGVAESGLYYLSNGTGAVLESDMPFEDNEDKIYLSAINKPVSRIATGYAKLPAIYKKYDASGNPSYYDANSNSLSNTTVKAYRNIIKEHIVKYGAISTLQLANKLEYYDNSTNPAKAKAYYCDYEAAVQDHEVTIVGWDDSYSKNNFNANHRPTHDGAYIVLNTYGTENFDGGYLHISYDDVLIEQSLLGITSTSKVDYDNLYQYDFYGGYVEIGTTNYNTGYIANKFELKGENEYLEYVGISSTQYANYIIYVNPVDDDLNSTKIVKVGEVSLSPGYTRVKIDKTKLQGTKFAVIIKEQQTESKGFYLPIEVRITNSLFEYVSAKRDTSYISFDGNSFMDLQDFNIQGLDMSTADTCIKAFTTKGTEPDPSEDPTDPGDEPLDPADDPLTPGDEPLEPGNDPVDPGNDPVDPGNDNPLEEEDLGGNSDNPEKPDDEQKPNPNDSTIEEELIGDDENNQEEKPDNPQEPEKKELEYSFKDYKEDKEYLVNVDYDTNVEKLLSSITTNADSKKVIRESEATIDGEKQKVDIELGDGVIVGTGDKLKLDDKVFVIVVKGDLNGDSKITVTDLSQIIAHFNEIKSKQLTGAALKAADMNVDGKISITDISKFVVLFGKIEQ